jgi:formylmethanofuran dehydrogenase subunit C
VFTYLAAVNENEIINHTGNLVVNGNVERGAIINVKNGGFVCHGNVLENVKIKINRNNDLSSVQIRFCCFSYTKFNGTNGYGTFGDTGGKITIMGDISCNGIFESSQGIVVHGNIGPRNKFISVSGAIKLIKGCDVQTQISSVSGEIMLQKFLGENTVINSVSGDVILEYGNFPCHLAITSVSGDIVGQFIGENSEIESVSGDVIIEELHRNSTIKTTSGDISVNRFTSPQTEITSTSGSIYKGARHSVLDMPKHEGELPCAFKPNIRG